MQGITEAVLHTFVAGGIEYANCMWITCNGRTMWISSQQQKIAHQASCLMSTCLCLYMRDECGSTARLKNVRMPT